MPEPGEANIYNGLVSRLREAIGPDTWRQAPAQSRVDQVFDLLYRMTPELQATFFQHADSAAARDPRDPFATHIVDEYKARSQFEGFTRHLDEYLSTLQGQGLMGDELDNEVFGFLSSMEPVRQQEMRRLAQIYAQYNPAAALIDRAGERVDQAKTAVGQDPPPPSRWERMKSWFKLPEGAPDQQREQAADERGASEAQRLLPPGSTPSPAMPNASQGSPSLRVDKGSSRPSEPLVRPALSLPVQQKGAGQTTLKDFRNKTAGTAPDEDKTESYPLEQMVKRGLFRNTIAEQAEQAEQAVTNGFSYGSNDPGQAARREQARLTPQERTLSLEDMVRRGDFRGKPPDASKTQGQEPPRSPRSDRGR